MPSTQILYVIIVAYYGLLLLETVYSALVLGAYHTDWMLQLVWLVPIVSQTTLKRVWFARLAFPLLHG